MYLKLLLVIALMVGSFGCSKSENQNTPKNPGNEKAISHAVEIKSVNSGFAVLFDNGSVKTWGGFNEMPSKVQQSLESGVTSIYSTGLIFAALKTDGSVVTWSSTSVKIQSGVPANLESGTIKVVENGNAFAALKSDGSVVSWGQELFGGDASEVAEQLKSDVVDIFPGHSKFAALKKNGDLITWGWCPYGCDLKGKDKLVIPNVSSFTGNLSAMAAIKKDGSVETWGSPEAGGDSSSVASKLASGVIKIIPLIHSYSEKAQGFAALKNDGSVISWGSFSCESEMTKSGVKDIYPQSYNGKYAYTKVDGSIGRCGSTVQIDNVISIFPFKHRDAVFALKASGELIGFGFRQPDNVGLFVKNIVVSGNDKTYLALGKDGDVRDVYASQNSRLPDGLNSDVTMIAASYSAFAAVKSDGSILTWGAPEAGGVLK